MPMRVVLGADHAATELKEEVKAALETGGYVVEDVSPSVPAVGDDYPDYAFAVADRVAHDPNGTRGVLACDTGIGMAIAANKVPGAYAALALNEFGARRAREHNNANILVLGADFVSPAEGVRAVMTFLETPFSGEERHARRVKKIVERNDGSAGRAGEGGASGQSGPLP